MKMIIASGDLLLAIVNDVLDYAKLETDHVELNVMRSDLQHMLQSILYSIEMQAKHRGQSIKAIYDPYLPVFVNTDIRRIQQSKLNSISSNHEVCTTFDILMAISSISQSCSICLGMLSNSARTTE